TAAARKAAGARSSELHRGEFGTGNSAVVVFFFQAEDGIRDLIVTGVQTCALPIYPAPPTDRHTRRVVRARRAAWPRASSRRDTRSEERRVGKECRARWAGDQ